LVSLQEKHQSGIQTLKSTGTLKEAKILDPRPSPRPFGYRSIFKLATRPSEIPNQRFAIGLFEPGTHQVLDMDQCPLHTDPLKRLLKDLRQELQESPLEPYDERTRSGQLRYLVARSAHLTGEILLTFVVTEPVKALLRPLVIRLQELGHRITSAHMNLNNQPGNAIMGTETSKIAGSSGLRERLMELDFEIGPHSFFQVNPWQAQQLYSRVDQLVGQATPEAVAWDLYSGVGQIALVLGKLGYRVLAVEEIGQAAEDAKANAVRNHLGDQIEAIASRVEDLGATIPTWALNPQVIVANPSRRGIAPEARSALAKLLANRPQTRLIYVSCDVETLARDLKDITDQAGLRVRQVESFDMFPQTDKMEWVAVLTH
jgi:23S rRNA (uracil1939-C5)-methyltransferase